MPAKTAAKTTKGARAKVAEKPAAKPAAKSAKPKSTSKAVTGAKTSKNTRAKVQEAPAKKDVVYPTSIADKKPWTNGSKVNKKTGFTEGTVSDLIAQALIKGGPSRAAIVRELDGLPTQTKKGTTFQRANVAATVERQMKAMGFEVVQSYKLVPPKRAKG